MTKYNRLVHKFRHSGYVLERMFTKFSEITQYNGHYAVQGHSRSPILVTNRKLIHDFLLVINTNLPPPFPSYGWLLVKFSRVGSAQFIALAEGDPLPISP